MLKDDSMSYSLEIPNMLLICSAKAHSHSLLENAAYDGSWFDFDQASDLLVWIIGY